MTAPATLTSYGFSQAFQTLLGSAQSKALLAVIQQSSLLQSMLRSFVVASGSGGIQLGTVGGGTQTIGSPTSGQTIYVDPSLLKGSPSLPKLADVLAHELGHATLPTGHLASTSPPPNISAQPSISSGGKSRCSSLRMRCLRICRSTRSCTSGCRGSGRRASLRPRRSARWGSCYD